jgi:hypothetical protein
MTSRLLVCDVQYETYYRSQRESDLTCEKDSTLRISLEKSEYIHKTVYLFIKVKTETGKLSRYKLWRVGGGGWKCLASLLNLTLSTTRTAELSAVCGDRTLTQGNCLVIISVRG